MMMTLIWHRSRQNQLCVTDISDATSAGPVRRKWVWSLLFAPLWGSLFINFGIGPIVSRTSDPWPIVGNAAGFVAAAALVQFSPLFAKSAVEGPLWKKKDP